ncbi:TOX high mobility group box family member 3 isoform X1 [Paramormyrops kingsleyae]|uniref:TOX high mobility group box family member 3 n=2 Tax=Paramormyrops kingsleyae TaxID=1676925 RepID=A0A3B3QJ87_9TELE|nr:TOX high mobility group box family member 3 isoform X1 [Paramormyrops kingsleyae]
MDVRFYPSASGNPIPGDPSNLNFSHCLGYYNYNKFGNHNNYMNMAEANSGLLSAGDQTFHTPSLGDEEFEIPPITPPPEAEPGLGLTEAESSSFPGLPEVSPSQRSQFTPHFPPQSLDLPSITISRNLLERDGALNPSLPVNIGQSHLRQYHSNPSMVMRSIINMNNPSGMMSRNQLTTINQSQLSAQLGLNMTIANIPHTSPSPPASKSATPSPSSSINEEDPDESNRVIGEKRPAPDANKKPKTPKKKKKKDPNEPQKPVSAYALFFRDTQAAIKGQNPNATFGEVSKIVASMWDGLGEEQKQVYKSKTEAAKKEYLKALAAYRASLVSKAAAESAEAQTIRSVQQTLASTNLSPSLMLSAPMAQHPSMSAASQALQQVLPRAIAPKPLPMRLAGGPVPGSVAGGVPHGMPSQLIGQMGAGTPGNAPPSAVTQMSPPMQPQQQHHHQMQQLQQHLHQQQLHHQQIQQQMQQQHFQQHLKQQLQQHHMQQQQQHVQQQQMQQLQRMQMQQLHQQQMQQLQQQQQASQCSPPQQSPGTPQSVGGSASLGSPQPPSQQQHQSQIQSHSQAHAQVLSQVSIY